MAFHRILVGLSGGARDAALVEAAVELGAASEANLSFAHVIDVASTRTAPPPVRAAMREYGDSRGAAARERLIDLAAELVPLEMAARSEVQCHVIVQGSVERDLAGLARSQSIDLVVVGSGPVAARLAAFTPCPTLVLP